MLEPDPYDRTNGAAYRYGQTPLSYGDPGGAGRSIPDLVKQLFADAGVLVRKEIALAKSEAKQEARAVSKELVLIVGAAVVAIPALTVLLFAAVFLLGYIMPLAASAFIVAIVTLGVCYVVAKRGLEGLKRRNLAPERTINSVQTDVQTVKEAVR